MSGNEISQILLSLFLSYAGGQRNRPLWIAWGVAICGLSCFILALPHFIYGAGDDALRLTKEFQDQFESSISFANSSNFMGDGSQRLCSANDTNKPNECDELFSVVPLVLIFLSQFVLGIGNTLYYSLGQAYLDDNTKKTNTPQLLGYAFSLRMFGPLIGFFVAYAFLNMYIDPTKTPLISPADPRWMGAWWMGWIVVGSIMMVFAILIGMFPKDLPKKPKKDTAVNGEAGTVSEEAVPLKGIPKTTAEVVAEEPTPEIVVNAKMKDFPAALARLFRNKVIMFNIISGIFYILGASGYMTFFAKYIEVQFHKARSDSTIIAGPVNLFGMVAGFLISGWVITKRKPSASKLLFWNVILGCIYVTGTACYLFLTCPDDSMPTPVNGRLNLTRACNEKCFCDDVPYNPVCNEATGVTYFSACHAGCTNWDSKEKFYGDCSCLSEKRPPIHQDLPGNRSHFKWTPPVQRIIPAADGNNDYEEITLEFSESAEVLSAEATKSITDTESTSSASTAGTTTFSYTGESETSTEDAQMNTTTSSVEVETAASATDKPIKGSIEDYDNESQETPETSRRRRSVLESTMDTLKTIPGACMAGCSQGFFLFALVSSITNFMGATGKIGNVLVNYRAVSVEDKSFTQGLVLMMFSLFGLIPGPILYGWIIDQTCMVWNYRCEKIGNCQVYNQRDFRIYVNTTAIVLTTFGMFFDFLVWYYGRNLDFYSEDYAETNQKQLRSKTKRKP